MEIQDKINVYRDSIIAKVVTGGVEITTFDNCGGVLKIAEEKDIYIPCDDIIVLKDFFNKLCEEVYLDNK